MSVKQRPVRERLEIAKRREQFWKDQCRDAETKLDELRSQHRDEIDKHNQAPGMGPPSSRITNTQACGQTHSENLVLVGLDGKYCVHYQLQTNYYYAYHDGKDIGGGNTLRAAWETYKGQRWVDETYKGQRWVDDDE